MNSRHFFCLKRIAVCFLMIVFLSGCSDSSQEEKVSRDTSEEIELKKLKLSKKLAEFHKKIGDQFKLAAAKCSLAMENHDYCKAMEFISVFHESCKSDLDYLLYEIPFKVDKAFIDDEIYEEIVRQVKILVEATGKLREDNYRMIKMLGLKCY